MSSLEPGRLLEEIRTWVVHETPTHEAASVDSLMDLAEAQLAAIGLRTRTVPGRDGLGKNLMAETPWGENEPGILVLSHLDTVHPLGTLETGLPFRIEGDRAFGPGIYDMKGGAWLGVAAIRAVIEGGGRTPLPIRWVFGSDEEVGSPTSKALIEAEGSRARWVLVTEPARDGGRVVTARKGTARYVLHARGRPSHAGSRPQDGRSAIRELCRQVLELEGLTDFGRGVTVNVGMIRGGTAFNVVPEHAEAFIDVRVPDRQAADEVLPVITDRLANDPDVVLTIEGGLNRPPFAKGAATAGLLARAQELARELGFALEDTMSGGGSDGNFLAHRLPVLDGLGVDGAGAHTHEEHLLISSLVPRARLLQRLFETLD